MLSDHVVQTSKLSPRSCLERWGVKDCLHVCLVEESWSIEALLETVDCLFVLFARCLQALNHLFGCAVLEGVLQVRELLRVGQLVPIVDRYDKLFSKGLPIDQTSIKSGDVQLRQSDSSRCRRHRWGLLGVTLE